VNDHTRTPPKRNRVRRAVILVALFAVIGIAGYAIKTSIDKPSRDLQVLLDDPASHFQVASAERVRNAINDGQKGEFLFGGRSESHIFQDFRPIDSETSLEKVLTDLKTVAENAGWTMTAISEAVYEGEKAGLDVTFSIEIGSGVVKLYLTNRVISG
jgi:hypothetical protein